MNPPLHSSFRILTLLFAAILGLYCIWLPLAELFRPSVDRLPTDPQSAAMAAEQRNDANRAAWIGRIRGDLWAHSAYTYADMLWNNPDSTSQPTSSLDQVRERLDRAVRFAPHQSGAWLLLAGLASRYRWFNADAAEALRMSYYTGPSERPLIPLRTLVAGQLPALDNELQQLARRDLRVLIAQQEQPAVMQAYQAATPAGKHFIEQAVGEIDPTLVESLRRGVQ
jgi:hypothetical protein